MMTTTASKSTASTLWILLLTAASTVTTLVLACATPFPSLAAVHVNGGDGIVLMLLAWVASQAKVFGECG
jgi:succinate-acetate transporter protein